MYIMSIGQRLKHFRSQAGLTQKEVEAQLGLRDLAMKDYETERLKLPAEMASRLAALYLISVDELLGEDAPVDSNHQKRNLQALNSLFHPSRLSSVYLDPVIRAYLENYREEIMHHPPLELLTRELSVKQKRDFTVDLLKTLASLMGIDEKVTPEELAFFHSLITELGLDDKSRSISRTITQAFHPKDSNLPKSAPHLKHFLIWTMFFLAQSDGEIQTEEIRYIEECADQLKINRSNYLYIKKFFVKERY